MNTQLKDKIRKRINGKGGIRAAAARVEAPPPQVAAAPPQSVVPIAVPIVPLETKQEFAKLPKITLRHAHTVIYIYICIYIYI